MSWIKSATSYSIGKSTEEFAKHYLIQNGLDFVAQNVHCRQGEIDLVMKDKETYVFVEVKFRKNNLYGGAISAVSQSKQQKIKHCVAFFLHNAQLNEYNTPCRFDVIALEGDIKQPNITWLKNAF